MSRQPTKPVAPDDDTQDTAGLHKERRRAAKARVSLLQVSFLNMGFKNMRVLVPDFFSPEAGAHDTAHIGAAAFHYTTFHYTTHLLGTRAPVSFPRRKPFDAIRSTSRMPRTSFRAAIRRSMTSSRPWRRRRWRAQRRQESHLERKALRTACAGRQERPAGTRIRFAAAMTGAASILAEVLASVHVSCHHAPCVSPSGEEQGRAPSASAGTAHGCLDAA